MAGLPTEYQEYIHLSRYSRWQEDRSRRETWEETVSRYIHFFFGKSEGHFLKAAQELQESILSLDVMPSMRCLMTAGPALERDNVAGYNCSYVAVDNVRAFDETMYVLMCGTGVGFSVERQYTSRLPEIAEEFDDTDTTISVADSKIGWAKSFRELLSLLYTGQVPRWDVSKVRSAGEKLKTFGGRASGPEPLVDLFEFSVGLFKNAAGRKLSSIECHDLMCKIADIVVVGGVRRSALISLSNLTDERMRVAKSGEWWHSHPHRALANNSVAYTEKPDMHSFMKEWSSLYDSKAGERGIFSREASRKVAERNGRRDPNFDFGTNPCSEIILRSKQFCNLTEVVVRGGDTFEDLKRKVRNATILGTLQSTLTNFRYLSSAWKRNTEEERLLGVSLTGIMDHPILGSIDGEWWTDPEYGPLYLSETLKLLKEVAVETNKEWSEKLGINPSAAITCVKPSGTVSQLVDSASGIHPRYSKYYIRTVRSDNKDPLTQMMIAQGIPNEPALGKEGSTTVFSFPVKAPEGSVMRDDMTALEQLELWKVYAEHWCEHKPSITVYVKEDEWMAVGAWVYDNFDIVSGVSFLPYDGGSYKQAPYQEITEERYNELKETFPKLDWSRLAEFESSDNVSIQYELACSAGVCEL